MISQIAYTNSNCSDVWEMFIGENIAHTTIPLYLISDMNPRHGGIKDVFVYSNDDPYWKVWSDAVEYFGLDYFIYLQEDFILYADVDEDKIYEYQAFLFLNPEYSFIRLLKATSFKDVQISETLYEIESSNRNVFSMQPTIWRSSDYVKLMNTVRREHWTEKSTYRKNIMRLGMKGAYHYDGEEQKGKYHYDSDVYPYIATALVRGKWNTTEYGFVLCDLLRKYGIDINERGEL